MKGHTSLRDQPSREHHTWLYLSLCAGFVTTLLVADMGAGKFFSFNFFSFTTLEISSGVIPFPIAFLITDIVNEFYGQKGAQRMTWLGMGMLIWAFLFLWIMRALPTSAHSPVSDASFNNVFGLSYRFFGASMLAYLISQFTDIHTFHWYKRLTSDRHLWLRALGSTAISQVVDTTVVNVAALSGLLSWSAIAEVTGWNYFYKMTVAALLTPLCYVAHHWIITRFHIQPMSAKHQPIGDLPFAGP